MQSANTKILGLSVLMMALTGCSTLTGIDGGSKFACKAPEGVVCSSLFGVYSNAVADNLPSSTRNEQREAVAEAAPVANQGNSKIQGRVPSSGEPIRTGQKVMRIWVAPFEDQDGDLHDQSYIYVVAHSGRWNIEHNQRQIMDAYRPTFIDPAANRSSSPAAPSSSRSEVKAGVALPAPAAQIFGAASQPPIREGADSDVD